MIGYLWPRKGMLITYLENLMPTPKRRSFEIRQRRHRQSKPRKHLAPAPSSSRQNFSPARPFIIPQENRILSEDIWKLGDSGASYADRHPVSCAGIHTIGGLVERLRSGRPIPGLGPVREENLRKALRTAGVRSL